MEKLSERNATLLIMGLKKMGTMRDAYMYVEEELYVDEAKELYNFCEWVDDNVGGCSSYNIEMLFLAFKNPEDKKLQEFKEFIQTEIAKIRETINKTK